MADLIELRLRNWIPDTTLDRQIGRILTPGDFSVVCTGPVRLLRPSGDVLAVYLPGVLAETLGGHKKTSGMNLSFLLSPVYVLRFLTLDVTYHELSGYWGGLNETAAWHALFNREGAFDSATELLRSLLRAQEAIKQLTIE